MRGTGSAALTAATALGLMALLAPVLVVAVPPLVDFPNHLARLWLLTRPIPAPLAQIYAPAWDTLTNIGIDLLAVVLSWAVDYTVAGRIVVALAVLLPPLGATVLYRVLHGRWHWWQLSFGLLAWSMATLDGFLNFEIGMGAAMLAASLEPLLSRRPWWFAFAARIALTALLLLVHAFAVLFYAALICAFLWAGQGPPGRVVLRIGLGAAGRAASVVTAIALMATLAPHLPGAEVNGGLGGVVQNFQNGFASLVASPLAKLKRAVVGLRSYSDLVDVATAAVLATPVLAAAALRRLHVHVGMALVTCGLVACFFVFPFYIAGGSWIDARFVHMAPYTMALALCPDLPGRWAGAMAGLLLAMSFSRTSSVTIAWRADQTNVESVRRAIAAVPPGAAILAVEHQLTAFRSAPFGRYTMVGEATYRHLPALAIPWRMAFIPSLFAARGMQPVRVLPPWSRLSAPDGGWLLSVDALVHPERYAGLIRSTRYWAEWQADFDYVLVLNADMPDDNGPFIAPASMTLVADEGFARLFAVARTPPGPGGSQQQRAP